MQPMRFVSLGLLIVLSMLLAACQFTPNQSEEVTVPAEVTSDPTATPSHSTTFDPSKYARVYVYTIEERENDGRSLLHISYPVTEQDAINARMEAVTQQFIDEYRNEAALNEEGYQEYKKETGWEAATFITHYRQSFDVSIASENVIFFDVVRSIHTGGTGNSYVMGFIFDRRSGEEVTIPDLFVDDGYLERLSALTREALSALTREALAERISKEELLFYLDWVERGTAPTAKNFDNFLFRDDATVLIMFDKYQVAPGAQGVVEVVLPVGAIADLLKPEMRELLGIEAEATAPAVEFVEAARIEESENDERSQLNVSYPVTEKGAINARMEAITQAFIDEYRTTAADIEKAFQDNKKDTGQEAAGFVTVYQQEYDITVTGGRVIFVTVTRSRYTGGTGNTAVAGYIFDRRSGAELTIPELFVDDGYLERLSALSREALVERARDLIAELEPESDDSRRKEFVESEMWHIEAGTTPTAENFDSILIRDDGTLLVSFDKYQVGSGVYGVIEIELDVAAISDLLKPEARQLLGIEADEGRLQTEFAETVEQLRAGVTIAPAIASAHSSAWVQLRSGGTVQLTFSSVAETDSPDLAQTGATAEDGVNCNEVACVALTFDDGPSIYTEGLLDILKEHDVQATFFILGQSARIQSETVLRIFEEGHEIGNHTWNHPNLTQLSDELIQQQLQQTDDIVTQIIGEPTQHLRPPYGAYNDRVRAVSGLPIIFWSVDPMDWRDRDAEIVAARIIESPAGAIILSHDIHRTTVAAVPTIIAALRERGIHFVTVTKLLGPQPLVAGNVYARQSDSPSE